MVFVALLFAWTAVMAVTGVAIFDLTGSSGAAWAAALMPPVFPMTGLVPNGAWPLPPLAVACALTARVLRPAPEDTSAHPVAAVQQPGTGG